jgi:hypothetical protein
MGTCVKCIGARVCLELLRGAGLDNVGCVRGQYVSRVRSLSMDMRYVESVISSRIDIVN